MRALRTFGVVALGVALGVVALTVDVDAAVAMLVGVIAGYLLGYGDGIVVAVKQRGPRSPTDT